jgi:Caspase domain
VVLIGTTVCPLDSKKIPPLPQVAQNLISLVHIFSNPDIVGLPPETIKSILDVEEASAIGRLLLREAQAATDTLIVYYAGHGLYGDSLCPLYLAAGNTTSDTKWITGIRITDLKTAIRESPARKRILVLDCCFSGRAFGGMSAANEEITGAIDVQGTYGIAAVPGEYKALAPPELRLTKFTQTLVDVLERGIADKSDVLTIDDIFHAVRAQIYREGGMPLPQRDNSNEGSSFRLAKNRFLSKPASPITTSRRQQEMARRLDSPAARRRIERLSRPLVKIDAVFWTSVFITDASGIVVSQLTSSTLDPKLVIQIENITPVTREFEVTTCAEHRLLSLEQPNNFIHNYGVRILPAMIHVLELSLHLSGLTGMEMLSFSFRHRRGSLAWREANSSPIALAVDVA